MHLWAVDTIQRVSSGIKRYIMTMIDPNSRIAFAVAIPSKHTKHTSKVLEALIDGFGKLREKIIRIGAVPSHSRTDSTAPIIIGDEQ